MNNFSLVIALSVSLGLGWTATRTPARLALETVDTGLAALVGALLGGRLGYVAAGWAYFQDNPVEIFQFWSGGLSASGALAGSILALILVGWMTRQHPGLAADRLLPLGTALVAGTWLACWISGAAYGPETNGWWGIPAVDEQGLYAHRLPVQVVGVVVALAWYAVLEARQDWLVRMAAGSAASLWLLGTALSLFGLSFLRADPARTLSGLRLDAWGALGVAALAALCFLAALLTGHRKAVTIAGRGTEHNEGPAN